jgi:hypothetical protein
MRTRTYFDLVADMPTPPDMSDEELDRREAKEDVWWGVCLILGCALLLGAAWLS